MVLKAGAAASAGAAGAVEPLFIEPGDVVSLPVAVSVDFGGPMLVAYSTVPANANALEISCLPVVFTLEEFVSDNANFTNLTFIPPSIDPLSPKNSEMSEEEVNNLMISYNIDPDRPILSQISRFDPWKDPLGVIDVYRNIKLGQVQKGIKGLQLVLIGSMAHDDPEGWLIYDRVMRKAGEDFDLNVYKVKA